MPLRPVPKHHYSKMRIRAGRHRRGTHLPGAIPHTMAVSASSTFPPISHPTNDYVQLGAAPNQHHPVAIRSSKQWRRSRSHRATYCGQRNKSPTTRHILQSIKKGFNTSRPCAPRRSSAPCTWGATPRRAPRETTSDTANGLRLRLEAVLAAHAGGAEAAPGAPGEARADTGHPVPGLRQDVRVDERDGVALRVGLRGICVANNGKKRQSRAKFQQSPE